MQSRLMYTARRSSWILSSAKRCSLKRVFCSAPRSQTADSAIHSGEIEAGPDIRTAPPQGTNSNAKFAETDRGHSKEDDPYVSPESPWEPSPKLKSTGVNQRLDPRFQQKRNQGSIALEDVICVALDGSQWPKDGDEEQSSREEKQEDEEDSYKYHKASPLSELELVDSRKPITRATDGTADSGRGADVIGWLPEQLDTAEEALRRATEIWRQNAMRGDPSLPHSRVLRVLRGEDF